MVTPGNHLGHGARRALEMSLDRSVGPVPDPARDAQAGGLSSRGIPECDPLDAAANGDLDADAFRLVGSHGG